MAAIHVARKLALNLKPKPPARQAPDRPDFSPLLERKFSMTFARKSLFAVNSLVLAGLMATAGVGALAQPANPNRQGDEGVTIPTPQARPQTRPQGDRMGRHDPAKMQAHMAKRQADMKAKLKITPAQEGAWTAFTASMQPPANMGNRPGPEQRAEMDKLTTPQRIDKMREMRAQRMAAMDKRMDATKTFYAALSPEQQKVFDAEHSKRGGRHGGGHHGMGGMEHRQG
jgi:periplasmic protein CpxP/Spy